MGVPLKWRVFFVAVTVVFVLTCIVWFPIPPTYLTNDDVAIRLGLERQVHSGQPATGFVLLTHSCWAGPSRRWGV